VAISWRNYHYDAEKMRLRKIDILESVHQVVESDGEVPQSKNVVLGRRSDSEEVPCVSS